MEERLVLALEEVGIETFTRPACSQPWDALPPFVWLAFLQTQQLRLGEVICPKPLTIEWGWETRPERSSFPSALSTASCSLCVGLSSLRLSARWGQGCFLPC